MGTETELKKVLVVGSTGRLGRLVVDELLDAGASVRALVREGKEGAFAGRSGVETVVGDLQNADSLGPAVEGVQSVVSCVQGGPDIIVDGQERLLEHAIRGGVRRLIPSDFSFDLFSLPEGANINSDWRRAFAQRASEREAETQVVHMLNGCFLDMGVLFGFLGAFDMSKGTMALWGDGEAPMDFTTYRDTARFTALAATRTHVPSRFEVAGDTMSFWELKAAVESAAGRSFEAVRNGSLGDLDRLIDERVAADPGNFYGYLPLMYWRSMLNGDGHLKNLVNDQFPGVKPTTIREFVLDNRDAFSA